MTINESIVRSNNMLDDRNDRVVSLIYNERKNQPKKVDEVLGLIKQVRSKSKDINTYINGLIRELNESKNDGDLLIVDKLLGDGKDGEVLLDMLYAYNKGIDTLMSKYPLPCKIPIDLTPPPPHRKNLGHILSWQADFFSNTPKIAAVTILNKFINDIKNTEALCIERFANESVATEIICDRFKPLVSAKSSHIRVGDDYEALIELGAFNHASISDVFVGDKKIQFKNGIAFYTAKATKIGTTVMPIIMKIPDRSGGYEEIQGELKYTVTK